MLDTREIDALIVGAGFGGIYQLYKLRELGLKTVVVDRASDVGGTWYWNRYPGATSDTESYLYRYTFDKEDLKTYPWKNHYVTGPEVKAYLEHVVAKYELRKDMLFKTELLGADWDESKQVWRVELSNGETLFTRYIVTALGLLSTAHYPDISGLDTFKGELVHTSAWRDNIETKGKRIGVIGCGSTGIQVITALAGEASALVCFQRHPQYSVPSGNRPVQPEYRQWVNDNYNTIHKDMRNSATCFGFVESSTPYKTVPPDQREAVFQEQWDKGNAFRFMFGGFSDITSDREANEAACDFIRRKIASIVDDPEKAHKLQPRDLYARRPLCDHGYYQQFNRDSVSIVDLKETPITACTPEGLQTSDGKVHVLDLIIFATGFDAIEGSYNRIRIRGRGGKTLKEHWDTRGPVSFMGVAVASFPNLLMVLGPQGPFTNQPPAIEVQVELNTDLIAQAEARRKSSGAAVVETTDEAEAAWVAKCEKLAEGSLFKETASWIFGNNVAGKQIALRFYFGGMKAYLGEIRELVDAGYKGLTLGEKA